MSRIERLKDYANPVSRANWRGAGRDKANIERWQERATENSDGHKHRAKSGAMTLPDTGEVRLHDTSERHIPADPRARAKSDPNFVGSSKYMPGVRRSET